MHNCTPFAIIILVKTFPLMNQLTQRLINRIQEKESFYDIAYICEDFQTFCEEINEWGVDHIGGVDLYGAGFLPNPELNLDALDAFFASFGCTPSDPHPCSKYALGV